MLKALINIIKKLIVLCILLGFIAWGAYLYFHDKYVVPIMMYHSINEVKHPGRVTLHTDIFEMHMQFLKDYNYNVISLDEFVEGQEEGRDFPRNTVVITFDDGYEDNYLTAYPILEEHGFPATMFVSSHFIGDETYMTWKQLRELADDGIIIGSHTRQHAYLPDLAYEQQFDEIVESKNLLEMKLKRKVKYFAYPIGGFDAHIKRLVMDAGYKAACTTNRGYDRFNNNLYELNRIRFSKRDLSKVVLFVKLSGYYNLFRDLKEPR